MSVNTFAQILVGAIFISLGIYLLRVRALTNIDKSFIIPLVFVISGWSIVIFAMDFNPYCVVAGVLFVLAIFIKGTIFEEMAFIFTLIGGLSFARATLGNTIDNTKVNGAKLTMVGVATITMASFWIFNGPIWTAIISWVLFALVASTTN